MADITYHYDDAGNPSEFEFDGKRHEISVDDRALVPTEIGGDYEIRDLQVTVRSTLEQMQDSYDGSAIVADIEATHFGYPNGNFYNYLASGGKKSTASWTKPYGKPYLINHDMAETPRGRVIKAKYVSTGPSTGYHALDTRIAHKDEIEMVLDARALTVSVGSNPIDKVECSHCSHDLFTDGAAVRKQVKLKQSPDAGWLASPAPGMYGMFGLTNSEFWDFKEDGKGYTVMCRHIKGTQAPTGLDQFDTVSYLLHQQNYKEVSRVNLPADYNHATGEFAHIRGILKQADGLDVDTQHKMIIDKLSRVECGSIDRARFSVVSEKDLYTPTSVHEAIDFAQRSGYASMFDSGQWVSLQATMTASSTDEQVAAYYKAGGRFVAHSAPPHFSIKDALALEDPTAFGVWLRNQDGLDRDEKHSLDAIYTKALLIRLRAKGE